MDSAVMPWISDTVGPLFRRASLEPGMMKGTEEKPRKNRVKMANTSVGGRRKGGVVEVPSVSSEVRIVLARKFMQTLDDHVYHELTGHAEERGVTIQGLIRAVIVPEWINSQAIKRKVPPSSQPNVSTGENDEKSRAPEFNSSLRNAHLLQR